MQTIFVMRWAARALSLGLAALFVAFAIGEGLPPLTPLSLQSLSFGFLALCVVGLLVAWRFEVVGAALALVGGAAFFLNDFALSGFRSFPSGWVFPLLLAAPLLYVGVSVLEHKKGT